MKLLNFLLIKNVLRKFWKFVLTSLFWKQAWLTWNFNTVCRMCHSVRLSVCYTAEPCLSGLRYRNVLHESCLQFFHAKFCSREFWGSLRTSALKRGTPMSEVLVWPLLRYKLETAYKVGCSLLLFTSKKLHMGFHSLPTLVTLNDVELCNDCWHALSLW